MDTAKKSPVQFYFDFSSPYGYFGATKIDELAAKYGRQVDWFPILLGAIFKITETKPLVNLPLKGPYSRHDLDRTARLHKIDFTMPTNFPISTHQTARAMLFIQKKHGKDVARDFAKSIYRAYFVDDVNIGEVDVILNVAAQCGLDRHEIEHGMAEQEIKDQLKADNDAAIAKGIFGAPFIMIDGEPFWGFDRFYQIETMFKNGEI
jgi:2-hydroxychromene-2-carboxylate isomerase